MANEKNSWLTCLKHIAFASLASFAIYMASAFILAAIFEHNKAVRFLVAYVFMMIFYAIFFYRFHEYNRLDTYAEHTDKFSLKRELLAYVRSEGKVMFIIFGICAVVTDVSVMILGYNTPNPIATVTMFCLGPWVTIYLPVLCSVLCFVYASAAACILAMLRSRKIYQ